MEKRVSNSPNQQLALTNCIFLNAAEHEALSSDGDDVYVELREYIFTARASDAVDPGCAAFNSIQRRLLQITNGESVRMTLHTPPPADAGGLSLARIEVDFVVAKKAQGAAPVEAADLAQAILARFGKQYLGLEQTLVVDWRGDNLHLRAKAFEALGADAKVTNVGRGILAPTTTVELVKAPSSYITLKGAAELSAARANLFRDDWSFEKMGIGGLDAEFSDIFRRAFASRLFPAATLAKLGIKHVKGMLLYGPPGTGKTLIARQIGKMLNGKEPKVVHGPEVLSKYVGESEENVRKLFADAEREFEERGDESELHIIIFDEIDSVCKQRGSQRGDTGVGDTVVNQLLSKIDGVHSLNNILVIGMTNRRDLIDEALLRPGRLEVQVEISLPDEHGRVQILKIHTASMREARLLAPEVDINQLAGETKNFSGAEIEGLIKSATSFAFARQVSFDNLKQVSVDNLQVTREDFGQALSEVRPSFGASLDDLDRCARGGVLAYGGALPQLQATCSTLLAQIRSSERTSLLTILLEGVAGTGKTALAASIARSSEFPFIRLVSPNSMLGMSELTKSAHVAKVFDDAHKSPLSIVVLDDIERLLEYVRIGPRFSNAVLQTLLTVVKKVREIRREISRVAIGGGTWRGRPQVPHKAKLVVIGTTSSAQAIHSEPPNPGSASNHQNKSPNQVLESVELADAFNVRLNVPALSTDCCLKALQQLGATNAAEVAPSLGSISSGVPIKDLLLVAEMSMRSDRSLDPQRFTATLQDVGLL